MGRLVADLDARPPYLGQAARDRRHGPERPSGGTPGESLRAADPLSQSAPGGVAHRGRAGRHLLGQPRPDAGPHGYRLGELPAYASDLPSAFGAAAEADATAGLYRQHG